MNVKPINVYDVIYEMLQNKIVPILAHPERYRFVQQDPSLIYELIDTGVLMQANYASIIGWYGKKAEILKKIEDIIGKEKLDHLTTINPKRVLQNEDIEVPELKEFKYSFKEKMIMKSKK